MHLVQTTVFSINAELALIGFIAEIRVVLKKLGINNFIRIGAAHRESIPDYGPLWFPK
ncbi:hypothetical protein D3C85_1743450 [compost metagenome]